MPNAPDPSPRPEPPSPWGDPFHYGLRQPPPLSGAAPRPDGSSDAGAGRAGAARADAAADDALVGAMLRAIGDHRSGPPTLWFLVLHHDDSPAPVVLPVEHATLAPSETVAALLVHVLVSVVQHEAPGGSVLVGYAREGGGADGAFERGWSSALRGPAVRAGLRIRAEIAIGPHRAGVIRGGLGSGS